MATFVVKSFAVSCFHALAINPNYVEDATQLLQATVEVDGTIESDHVSWEGSSNVGGMSVEDEFFMKHGDALVSWLDQSAAFGQAAPEYQGKSFEPSSDNLCADGGCSLFGCSFKTHMASSGADAKCHKVFFSNAQGGSSGHCHCLLKEQPDGVTLHDSTGDNIYDNSPKEVHTGLPVQLLQQGTVEVDNDETQKSGVSVEDWLAQSILLSSDARMSGEQFLMKHGAELGAWLNQSIGVEQTTGSGPKYQDKSFEPSSDNLCADGGCSLFGCSFKTHMASSGADAKCHKVFFSNAQGSNSGHCRCLLKEQPDGVTLHDSIGDNVYDNSPTDIQTGLP